MVAIITWVGIGVVGVGAIWSIITYNRLVSLKNQVENSWAQIDVQLKRRADLVPNLVKTVKGYAKHERETLNEVTKARTAIMNSGSVKEAAEGENMLQGALKSLFAVAESYPDLKANQNFLQLQEELSGTETKIAATRQYYNDTVMQFNTKIESFPSNLIAKMFQFKEQELFEVADNSERETPDVSF